MKTTIGAFEAHEESVMRTLWLEVLPFFNRNKEYGTREDKVFFSLMDFLDSKQDHWVWDKLESDPTNNPDSYFKHLANKLYTESLIVEKKVFNKHTGMEETQRVRIKENIYEKPKWIKRIKTPNGVLIRYTDKQEISIKGFTEGIIMSLEDYKNFKKALTLDLTQLTIPNLHKLIYDIKSDPSDPFWSRFTTLRTFYEDLLTELGDSPVKSKKKDTTRNYKVGEGFQRVKKYSSSMLDALDTSSI
jgi:hypothetical protein